MTAASLWLLFISAFTSATLLPGSSEAALIALLLANAKELGSQGVVILVATATFGNVLGSLVNWAMGRFFSHYRERKWFPVNAEELARAEVWYARWGIWSLALSWMPLIGDPITLVAGVMRTRFLVFITIVVIAKATRYAFLAWGVMAVLS
jgi:membrane protein YqaA with SNARE-associated domain